jgi:ATP-binding cassette, subfamily F, member 3
VIVLDSISKSFGSRSLFQGVNFSILPSEKLGLIGRNGNGKSTLAKIIAKIEEPDSGTISYPTHYRIGYLSQVLSFTQNTVLEEAYNALETFEGGWKEFYKADTVLQGLGFSSEQLELSPKEISGGFQLRLHLAKLLIEPYELLILDEPTNYLDITASRWMLKFLQEWQGELLLITHDRQFMDQIITDVAGIHRQKLLKLRGKTSVYDVRVAKDEEIHEKTRLQQEKEIAQKEKFINQFRAKARQASMVQSRIKEIEKISQLVELEAIPTLRFSFPCIEHPGQVIASATQLTFGYNPDDELLLEDLNFIIKKGERFGIIGPNGKGKSTLLKLLAKELTPTSGDITLSNRAQIGYYGQTNVERLNPNFTVEQEIASAKHNGSLTEIRALCGAMLFSQNDAKKKISQLSGGEKCRVLLGKILAYPTNILLLDEPTHHLDQESISALLNAIYNYTGSVIIVTHDEGFLQETAQKLIVFDGDKPFLFDGKYNEFLDKIGWLQEQDNEKKTVTKDKKKKKDSIHKNDQLVILRKKYELLEEKISTCEDQLTLIEEAISKSNQTGSNIVDLSYQHREVQKEIEDLFKQLELVDEEISNCSAN